MRCTATTKYDHRCEHEAKDGPFCGIHHDRARSNFIAGAQAQRERGDERSWCRMLQGAE